MALCNDYFRFRTLVFKRRTHIWVGGGQLETLLCDEMGGQREFRFIFPVFLRVLFRFVTLPFSYVFHVFCSPLKRLVKYGMISVRAARARISRETSFHGSVCFSNEHYLVRETCPNFLASCWLLEFSTERLRWNLWKINDCVQSGKKKKKEKKGKEDPRNLKKSIFSRIQRDRFLQESKKVQV